MERVDSLENEKAKSRYVEMVQALADGLVCRSCDTSSAQSWFDSVQIENQINPFDTILASFKIDLASAVSLENMYDLQLWNLPSQLNIKRTQEYL